MLVSRHWKEVGAFIKAFKLVKILPSKFRARAKKILAFGAPFRASLSAELILEF